MQQNKSAPKHMYTPYKPQTVLQSVVHDRARSNSSGGFYRYQQVGARDTTAPPTREQRNRGPSPAWFMEHNIHSRQEYIQWLKTHPGWLKSHPNYAHPVEQAPVQHWDNSGIINSGRPVPKVDCHGDAICLLAQQSQTQIKTTAQQIAYPTTQTAANDILYDKRDPEFRHSFMAQLHKTATRGGAVRGSNIGTDAAENLHLRSVQQRLARAAVNYANPNAVSKMADGKGNLSMHSHAYTGNFPEPYHFAPGIKSGSWEY